MIVFLNIDEWLGRLLRLFARDSLLPYRLVTWWAQVSMLQLLDSSTQDSLPSDFWSAESSSVLGLNSTLWSWTSSTNRFVPLVIITWVVVSWLWGDRIAISSPSCPRIFTIWTLRTGPITVLPGIAAKTRDWGFSRECMYSRPNGTSCLLPSSSSSRVLHIIPTDTRCLSQASSHSFEKWVLSDKRLKTKSCTSCDFTLVKKLLFTDLRFSRPFCSSVKPNCSLQFGTAPQILSWFTVWVVRNKSSVFNESPSKRMVSFPFFLFRNSRLKALMLWNTGWPVSLNRSTIYWVRSPVLHREGTKILHNTSFPIQDPETSSVLERISSRNPGPFLHSKYKSHFFVQLMLLNMDMKMIWSVNSSSSMLFLFKSHWISWRIYNDENPWKIFHSNSIASPSIPQN